MFASFPEAALAKTGASVDSGGESWDTSSAAAVRSEIIGLARTGASFRGRGKTVLRS